MNRRFDLIYNQLKVIKYLLFADLSKQAEKQLFDCPVCEAKAVEMYPVPAHFLGQWQKYQTIHNPIFFETMNLEHYLCSKCFSPDRDRLYALYLNEFISEVSHEINLLDIAPSNGLRSFLKNNKRVVYRSMDLMMENVDDKLDITDMHSYPDEQFDFFICSHVLEHIPDDIKAMRELYRITAKGGKGIVMVPINLQLENTMEDNNCTNTDLRWKYFFQDDHVRMYARKDFIERLGSAGFNVKQLDKGYFSEEVFLKNAVYPTSVLYVVEK